MDDTDKTIKSHEIITNTINKHSLYSHHNLLFV